MTCSNSTYERRRSPSKSACVTSYRHPNWNTSSRILSDTCSISEVLSASSPQRSFKVSSRSCLSKKPSPSKSDAINTRNNEKHHRDERHTMLSHHVLRPRWKQTCNPESLQMTWIRSDRQRKLDKFCRQKDSPKINATDPSHLQLRKVLHFLFGETDFWVLICTSVSLQIAKTLVNMKYLLQNQLSLSGPDFCVKEKNFETNLLGKKGAILIIIELLLGQKGRCCSSHFDFRSFLFSTKKKWLI